MSDLRSWLICGYDNVSKDSIMSHVYLGDILLLGNDFVFVATLVKDPFVSISVLEGE